MRLRFVVVRWFRHTSQVQAVRVTETIARDADTGAGVLNVTQVVAPLVVVDPDKDSDDIRLMYARRFRIPVAAVAVVEVPRG